MLLMSGNKLIAARLKGFGSRAMTEATLLESNIAVWIVAGLSVDVDFSHHTRGCHQAAPLVTLVDQSWHRIIATRQIRAEYGAAQAIRPGVHNALLK